MSNLVKFEDTDILLIDGDRGNNYPSKNEFYDNEYCLFLDAKNVTENGFDFSEVHFINKEKDQKLRNGKLKRNDIVMMTRGSVGNVAIFNEKVPYDNIRINSGMIIIRTQNDFSSLQLYYMLKSEFVQKQIRDMMSGSVQKQLPVSVIKKIKLNKKSINIDIVKSIDDKIINNSKIISELEEMAKTIYDYWFLQYEFPNEEGKPYKSSGGKMIYNDELKREIPECWKVSTIEDIVIEKGKSPMQVGDAKDKTGKYPFFTSGSEIYEVDEFLTEGRNCYLSTGGKGYVQYYVGKSSYSTDTWVISGKDNLEDYLYLFIKSIEDMLDIKYFAGTGLKHLQKDLFKDTHIVIPNEGTLKMFNDISNKLFNKISKIYKENKELTKLRDYLLPLLMNGQVSFKN